MKKTKSTQCDDVNCPHHGTLSTRGRSFVGSVISTKMQNTAIVEWSRIKFLQKYERYEKRLSKVKAHNPSCLNAKDGDIVKIVECRPLSKTKHFVIIEVMGKEKGFLERMEGREEAKIETKKKEEEGKEKETVDEKKEAVKEEEENEASKS